MKKHFLFHYESNDGEYCDDFLVYADNEEEAKMIAEQVLTNATEYIIIYTERKKERK